MRSTVEFVIYFYLFICVALLVFNVLYIMRSKLVKKRRAKRIRKWTAIFDERKGEPLTEKQYRELDTVEELIALQAVLDERQPDEVDEFVRNNTKGLQLLAVDYGKKSAMEKAFYAYVTAALYRKEYGNNDMMAGIMLTYMEDSTVFCRENVLHALYSLGRSAAIEHAFEIMDSHDWYHNPKLIADGMVKFTGDSEELITRLYRHRDSWRDSFTCGVIQYAQMKNIQPVHELFARSFTEEKDLPTEVRFSLIRYFQHHHVWEVHDELMRLARAHDAKDSELAVAAASALSGFPGADTKSALLEALTSRNWYVRHNAASSLIDIGMSEEEIDSVRNGGDRYAWDMLRYVIELKEKREGKGALA